MSLVENPARAWNPFAPHMIPAGETHVPKEDAGLESVRALLAGKAPRKPRAARKPKKAEHGVSA